MEQSANTAYEVIVINNNSPDDTGEVVKSALPSFGGKLRYFFEENQGISYARNRGIKEASGEFVAFIDDDVIVEKDWLTEIVKNLQALKADCIAGKIIPKWEIPKPRWITENLGKALGLLNYGDKPFQIASLEQEIVTANFIAKRSIFEDKKYLFKTYLGDKGKRIIKGEDTELFFNLMKGGYKIWYSPSVLVRHDIPKERMTMAYFLKWNYRHSESKIYLTELFPDLYNREELRKRMKEKFLECIKNIDKSYVELLGGLFFYIGLIKHRLCRANPERGKPLS